MKVTLGYSWEDHEPDETIEVDDATATQLINDGIARPADTDTDDGAPASTGGVVYDEDEVD
jgi:hypothetical protein